jgi:hypothetical protein
MTPQQKIALLKVLDSSGTVGGSITEGLLMQFTKGPWKYSTNVGPTKALIVEQDGSTVVEVGNRTQDSRFAANVRLMTAAPTLYDALEAALQHLEEIGDVAGCGGDCEIQEQCRAALESAVTR